MLVGFSQTSYTISEGDCFVTLDIGLSGLAAVPLMFNLSTISDVAMAGQDFVHESMTPLTINPGTVLSQATIQLINDNEIEMAVKSFIVMLEPSSEGVPHNVVTTNNRTMIYIQDDDNAPIRESNKKTTNYICLYACYANLVLVAFHSLYST